MTLNGKVALITGGNTGIGQATAVLFASEGLKISVADYRADSAIETQELVNASGAESSFHLCDVRSAQDCQQTVQSVIDRFGRLDILVNNAGIVPFGRAEDTDESTWDATMNTNVKGVFLMSRAAIPFMRKNGGGVIVNISSEAGLVGTKSMVAYSASKGAVVLLTKSMALDHVAEGIRINAVCPGHTYVKRWEERSGIDRPDINEYLAEVSRELPIGRVARAEEIAHAILFLASDQSSFIVGEALAVDGGYTAQ
ncbi:MAG: glucose 1-dehydrogenase [Thermoleophilia bacterium]